MASTNRTAFLRGRRARRLRDDIVPSRSTRNPFLYLSRCYKNPVLRAATLRELNGYCGELRLGPYKDRARAIIHTQRAEARESWDIIYRGDAAKSQDCVIRLRNLEPHLEREGSVTSAQMSWHFVL